MDILVGLDGSPPERGRPIALGRRGGGVGDRFLGRVTEYLLRHVTTGLLIAR